MVLALATCGEASIFDFDGFEPGAKPDTSSSDRRRRLRP